MKKIIFHQGKWGLTPQNEKPLDPYLVRIQIVLAGLCRTDIQTMTGQRTVDEGRTLGHEAAGVVVAIGSKAKKTAHLKGIHLHNKVAFFPFLPCGQCEACLNKERMDHCWNLKALGIHQDGAFASYIDLPIEVIFRVDDKLPWEALAYAEPVAAALSVLEVHEFLEESHTLGLLGEGRIATLTGRILKQVAGREAIPIHENTPNNSLDAVVETRATADTIQKALNVLKPGGVLFVKSRPFDLVPWPHQMLIHKRIRVIGLNYGDFEQGLDLMAQGTLDISDCWGPVFEFTQKGIQAALDMESSGRETGGKLFFQIGYELTNQL